MFRLIFTLYLTFFIYVLLAAPVDENSDLDEIAYEIENTVKNKTEIYYVDNDSVNKTKGYVENIIGKIKKSGNSTINSINKLKNKLLETSRHVKNIAKAKVTNTYDNVIEKTSIYFEIVDTEVRNFLHDVKPNVKKIENSIGDMFSTVTDSVGGIFDKFKCTHATKITHQIGIIGSCYVTEDPGSS
ncbi:hypothetical protein RN001_006126 [Aquatica leii]|uniref:Uncharacterized protein n=1 Tax=Aquatica leii TaxID=1421715 RepID=A0AAN7PCV3_9COLE|nr:hypothetical protein RN001_006126 [Aquatica leii]